MLLGDSLLTHSSSCPAADDVAIVQEFFDDPLPKQWTGWVMESGYLAGCGRALLGLRRQHSGISGDDREDALDILLLLRLTEQDFERNLLPIELLPERQLHCLVVGAPGNGKVVLVDLDRPDLRVEAAANLADFLYQWRADLHAINSVVTEVRSRPDTDETVLLRPDEWSTRRLCSQNVIVALLQTRHSRESNEHEVALFATATLTAFAPDAPTRWALTTILTETHQAGGSLAVNFVRRTKDGRVHNKGQRIPPSIGRWAARQGITLDTRETRWDNETGERLFVATTRLPPTLRELLPHTDSSPATVCAAIATGTWPALDVEIVLRWAADPRRILTGSVGPADRVRYLADQQIVRSAIILSSLHRHLQRAEQLSASDEDDTIQPIGVQIADSAPDGATDPTLSAVTFTSLDHEPLRIGWPMLAGQPRAADTVIVHVLASEASVLKDVAPDIVALLEPGSVLVVPADALSRAHELDGLFAAAREADVFVTSSPDYTTTMDVTIASRLDRSRMSRK